jgi:monoamine oxidase
VVSDVSDPRGSRGEGRPRALVVGAGLAGLRCAELLQRSGVAVEVHEASDRVGGRCWSAHGLAEGIVAEHGGEHIAPDHGHVSALASELGLELEDRMAATPAELRTGAVVFQDRRISPGEGTVEMARVLERVAEEAERVGDLRPDHAGDAARALDGVTALAWIEENVEGGSSSLVGRMPAVAAALISGVPADRLSAAAFLFMFALDPAIAGERPAAEAVEARNTLSSLGELGTDAVFQQHVRGGNDMLVRGLADRLLESTIVLGSPLTSLRSDGDGILGRFGDGVDVRADTVVLAIPITALREIDLDDAILSEPRRRAIRDLSTMGQNTKLLIGLDRPPSELPTWPGHLLDLDEPPLAIWDTTPAQPGPGGVLTVFTGGEIFRASEAHAEPSPVVIEQVLARLERLVPGVRARFNGRAWLDSWPRDPWTRGSYLGFGPGQYTRYWGFLGAPEGRIHLAGEHTSTIGQGYLDGAIESGERAAREVLDDFGLARREPTQPGTKQLP